MPLSLIEAFARAQIFWPRLAWSQVFLATIGDRDEVKLAELGIHPTHLEQVSLWVNT